MYLRGAGDTRWGRDMKCGAVGDCSQLFSTSEKKSYVCMSLFINGLVQDVEKVCSLSFLSV